MKWDRFLSGGKAVCAAALALVLAGCVTSGHQAPGAGGTGTPKLLRGADDVFPPAETTVVCNTGDDVELGGHLVCPDVDTVLFLGGDELDLDTWWGIADDSTVTDDELHRLPAARDEFEKAGLM